MNIKLIILRHGETMENKKRIVTGQLPGILSGKGLRQAKKLANRFKKEKIDVIISSSSKRAKDTAKIISKFHPKTPLKFANELKEMNFGAFQGKSLKKLGVKGKDIFWLAVKNNGESMKQIYMRAKKNLKNIKQKYKEKTVLISGHAAINRALVCVIKNIPINKSLNIIANPKYIVHGIYKIASR